MKRQFAIFLGVLVVFGAWGLIYGSQVVADLTLFSPTSVDVSGTTIVLNPTNLTASAPTTQDKYFLDVQNAQRTVTRRLDQLNLKDYYAVRVQDNQLEVTLPHHENTPYLVHVITQIGQIEFIDGGSQSPPVGQFVTTGAESSYVEGVYKILFTGQEITTVVPPNSDTGDIFYQIELQPAASERFTSFVNANTKIYVCVVIDKQVINCSKMYHLSGNMLDILPNLGGGTALNLSDLSIFLKSGPLPISLEVVTE